MNAVQFVIFALCIYQISAITYEEAVAICRKESNIKDSKTVDYFLKNAAWPADASASCYINCLGKQFDAVDEAGVPIKSKLALADAGMLVTFAEIAPQVSTKNLRALIAEPTLSTCIPQAKGPTACAASEAYVTCALRYIAASKPTKRMQIVA